MGRWDGWGGGGGVGGWREERAEEVGLADFGEFPGRAVGVVGSQIC